MSRIASRFAALRSAKKKAFVPFVAAGDPTLPLFSEILSELPNAGCDLIEIGMPFSDPMADGPAIQNANLRAFKAGITMNKVLSFVSAFRKKDNETPIVLMGYANQIYSRDLADILDQMKAAGVDGLILSDLPPEEDAEIQALTKARDIDFIRFVTPTTDVARLKKILDGARGFLYYITIKGTTGTKHAVADQVQQGIEKVRALSNLPVGVGFGITTPEEARALADVSDAVIVGSAISSRVAQNLDAEGNAKPELVKDVLGFVASLAEAAHKAG